MPAILNIKSIVLWDKKKLFNVLIMKAKMPNKKRIIKYQKLRLNNVKLRYKSSISKIV